MDAFKEMFGSVDIILRYVASGFIALLSMAYIDLSCYDFFNELSKISPWLLFGIAVVVGVFLYAVHQALLDKMFYELCINCYKKKWEIDSRIKSDIAAKRKVLMVKNAPSRTTSAESQSSAQHDISSDNLTSQELRFFLFSQGYLRRASKIDEVLAIQKVMDQKLALLNFLYCATYSFLFSVIVRWILQALPSEYWKSDLDLFRVFIVLLLSIISFSAAFKLDYRTTEREFWTVSNFYMKIKKVTNGKPEIVCVVSALK